MKAALIIIGNEILSGRTQDKNLSYLANWLNEIGIQLSEVRVIRDEEKVIIDTVNHLRSEYDYVFESNRREDLQGIYEGLLLPFLLILN